MKTHRKMAFGILQRDGHVILNTQGVLDSAITPAKGIRTGCPDAPSDGFVSHGEREIYKSVGLLLGIKRLPGSPSSSCEGALSSYEWLSETMVGDAAVRDRGKRLCRMIVGSDLLSLPLVFSFCRRFISGWLMLIIRMCCGDYPDVYALPASFALPWIGEAKRRLPFLEGFCFGFVVKMAPKKLFRLSGSARLRKGDRQINAKEFRERFRIPHDVLIDLVNEEAAMPTEKGGKNAILFHKGTIQRGAPVPSALVQGIPPLLSDSTHLHSSQPCPGADGMQHYQHAVQPRPYATGIVLCLFPEESKE
ncbi:hypothetical protein CK203_106364 [Vitis vinifera]|uniref:Uncharacterized protein n=1 Tax=Vitis vinifera TaxID=29760 RepID=A0A438F7K7_VITVI|nr:hypothetical protein CK203_106364 [Vitis vinifera]